MIDHPATKLAVELSALGAVAGALAQILPPLAAGIAIIWYAVQIWQSETGKNWRGRWHRLLVEHKDVSFADRVCFIFLAMAGSGVAFILWVLMRIIR